MLEIKIGEYDELTLERLTDKIMKKVEDGDYNNMSFDLNMTSTQHVEIKDGVMTVTGKVIGNGHEFEPTVVTVTNHEWGYESGVAALIFTKVIYDREVEDVLKEGDV